MTAVQLINARTPGKTSLPPLLVRDGVLLVGVEDSRAERVDLDGRYLIAGLWDQHVHLGQWAMFSRRLDLADAPSASACAARCRAALAARRNGADEPLLGYGILPARWADEPTAALLDEAGGQVPVVVSCGDLHSCWASTAALRHYDLAHLEPGLLKEEDCFELMRRMSDLPEGTLDAWVAEAARAAAARGVVGVVDMEMQWNQDDWIRRMDAGFDHLRVRAAIYPQWLERAIERGLRTGDVDPARPLLAVGPLKCITDGSLNTRTAYCHDAYAGSPAGQRGVLNFSPVQVHDLLTRASAHGLECAIHAIGDAANAMCLDAFAATGARGRIEHAQLLADADVSRFAALGVVASVQPQHALDDRACVSSLWPGREERTYRFRDLLTAGATLVLGSDAPVAALDPWHQLQAAVERALPGDEPFFEEQRLTPAEALTASTDGHGFEVADAMIADLAIVEDDPLHARAQGLREMPVAGTLVGGRWTHRALP